MVRDIEHIRVVTQGVIEGWILRGADAAFSIGKMLYDHSARAL
jgi:hypothetical protein